MLETTQTELARSLHKGTASLRSYLREMETAGVCRSHFSRSPARRGRIEVTAAFWPYRKPESQKPDPAAEAFVGTLKKMLQARPCIQTAFSTADEILAHCWFQQGLSLERIEPAILLGCIRWNAFSTVASIPNSVTAPAWAFSVWQTATARSDWKRPADVRSR